MCFYKYKNVLLALEPVPYFSRPIMIKKIFIDDHFHQYIVLAHLDFKVLFIILAETDQHMVLTVNNYVHMKQLKHQYRYTLES